MRQLYRNGDNVLYPDDDGKIYDFDVDEALDIHAEDWNNCKTEQQAKRIIALGKLMNAALYVNHGWLPNWKDKTQEKWYLLAKDVRIHFTKSYVVTAESEQENKGNVYFKSRAAAAQALILVGKETIKDYYCIDWMDYEHTIND